MSKRILLFVLFIVFGLLIIVGCSPSQPTKSNIWNNKDEQEVRQTALDYIEGWYEGNSERMEKALHPKMIKRRVAGEVINQLDYETMIDYVRKGGGKNVSKDSYKIEVKVLDINGNIASVMTKSEYIDYLHLAKINDKWIIINVLWDANKDK